jgi:hypothetical protein
MGWLEGNSETVVIWKVMRNIGGIWEMETALILEVMEMEDKMDVSYRGWAANAIYSIFLHMLPAMSVYKVK